MCHQLYAPLVHVSVNKLLAFWRISPNLYRKGQSTSVSQNSAVTKSGTGTWDVGLGKLGTRGLGDAGTRGRGDSGTRGRGDVGTRGLEDSGTRGRGDSGTWYARTSELGDARGFLTFALNW